MAEAWLPVAEFPEYDVSTLGRIRSHKTGQARIRRQAVAANDSLMITFTVNSKNHTRLTHLVVADAFLGPRPVGTRLSRLDGDKQNNELSNLRYEPREAVFA
jgi:hypothetical protein